MRRAVIVLLSFFAGGPVTSWAQQNSVTIFGVGDASCAAMMQDGYVVSARDWSFGYFSALNDMNDANSHVGNNTDSTGLMGEIELECSRNPSESLRLAVFTTYQKLRIEGR
jgi:hypothetical protein